MEYQILSSLKTPSALEAMQLLSLQVREAMSAGGQLVGGVCVTFNPAGDQSGYLAFQAMLIPKSPD